jgi:CBS-domain-containing membrane protein
MRPMYLTSALSPHRTTVTGGDTMTALIGDDCSVWLVAALLTLALGLSGALLAALRDDRSRPPRGAR